MIGSPSFGVWLCNNKSKSTVESTFDDAKIGCDFAIEKSKINRISNRKTKHLGNLLTKVKERK